MARAQSTDYLHAFRFHANVVNAAGAGILDLRTAQAGFSNVTTPQVSVAEAPYKEGSWVYTRKYPGNPTVENINMARGVARMDSSFWDWMRVVIEGGTEYRADIDILHYHRDTSLQRGFPTDGSQQNAFNLALDKPARTYHVREAFPSGHQTGGELESGSNEISIMTLAITFERFEVEEHAAQ